MTYSVMEKSRKEKLEGFECEVCHLRFANKTYLESHIIIIEHKKHMVPSGVQ
ncbi:hypothetical protein NTE_03467 [Candidatus Nitrososphaera evergladensis SR1]|uniref:C2H2-type domain-containing protein n=1 Tax=Candidatus Nitrososphaera evergladensis SR1 TaxID=1459636 RepID=A0A075MSI9_9ARCH|nr:hypothetical protein NTE_02067 [Candidatus Nitrososphaera evergladensis SR1]AIF85495.1 hypothetical protein NTE_03467 [Candidatus Nitrososphaera evergladensis SR1]